MAESSTVVVETPGGSPQRRREGKCPLADHHLDREDVRRVIRECRDESFWSRALPLSLGSMAITGGLIYNGVFKSSGRFGPLPKVAVAGVLGYAVGKASYMSTCREKFHKLGLEPFGPGFGPGFWHAPEHRRHCHHVCEECKKEASVRKEMSHS